MKAKITKQTVERATPSDGKPLVIFDSELAGFACKVTPAGARSYQLRYRMGGRAAPLRTFTLGQHGPMTADQARKQAQALLGDVRRGIDPAAEKRAKASVDRSATNLDALFPQFMAVRSASRLKPRTAAEYQRMYVLHIAPALGARPVGAIVHGDIERLHHGMKALPYQANRVAALLSVFFSWAIRAGYATANPVKGLEKNRETARKRYLSPAEIAAVGEAIRSCEATGRIDPWQAGLVRALMLTGLRRDELRTLRWEYVNLDRAVLALPDTKTGARDVPLSAPMLELLAKLPRVEGNPFVFCGARAGQPLVNVKAPWKAILAASGVAPCRPHDLRHTMASIGVAAGHSLLAIGAVLGHANQQTTARYAHLADDPVRATSEAIAQRVAAALDNRPSGEVVPLRKPGSGQ